MDEAPQGDLVRGGPLDKANLSPTAGISVQTRPKKITADAFYQEFAP